MGETAEAAQPPTRVGATTTGKEEDIDVGLTYFGKRYLSPYLNRWISADPLAVHGLGADPNLYAYVSGQALKAVDPLGLEGANGESGPSAVGMKTPIENVGVTAAADPDMPVGESPLAKWSEDYRQGQAALDAAESRIIESKNRGFDASMNQGRATISDGTRDLRVAAAAEKAEQGLSTMAMTTPFAPEVVTLQAMTGNNDAAVVGNHIGMIGGASLAPYGGGYSLRSETLRPPRVECAPAQARASPMSEGRAFEKQQLQQLRLDKNNDVWRPEASDINSAAFRVIVGPAKYTRGGKPVGTIFDSTQQGNVEIKGGSSTLNSSYQLRLQVYHSLKFERPMTIVTSRPVNPTFADWLRRWGVQIQRP